MHFGLCRGSISEELVRSRHLCERVLGSEHALCSRAVPLSFGVFLEGVGHGYCPVAQVLSVHRIDCCVTGVKTGEVYERKSLRVPSVGVSHNLWRLEDNSEGTKYIVQHLLVNLWVQVSYKDVGTHVQVFSI